MSKKAGKKMRLKGILKFSNEIEVWYVQGCCDGKIYRIHDSDLDQLGMTLPDELSSLILNHEIGVTFEVLTNPAGKFQWARNISIPEQESLAQWAKEQTCK